MFKKLNAKQIERFMMVGFVFIFLFWMARSFANNTKSDKMQPIAVAQEEPVTETPVTTTTASRAVTVPLKKDTVFIKEECVSRPTALFVWAEGLKVRTEPYLTSSVVVTLPLNTQLDYKNEISAFKQRITLDGKDYDEPWLKVQTTDGKIGWVYGGGVRLYQK